MHKKFKSVQEIDHRCCWDCYVVEPSIFAAFSLYHFKTDPTKQTAVAYTSTIITFLFLVGVIAYHVYLLIRREKTIVELNEYPLVHANAGVTHSVVEVHQPQCDPPESDSIKSGDIKQNWINRKSLQYDSSVSTMHFVNINWIINFYSSLFNFV